MQPPPFDRDKVIGNLGGDEELLKQIAELFVGEWPANRDRLQAALAAGEAEDLRAAAHSVKGAVMNFCADRAVQAAKTLEMTGKSGDLSLAAAQFEEVVQAVEEVVAALRREIGA